MGLGSFWDPNEHPRGWHGRFAKKWKISDVLRGVLDHFTPRTFQSDSQAGQYAFNQGHKNGPFSSVELTRLRKDWDEASDHLRAGDMDPQTQAFDTMMQSHMRPTSEGLIATTTFGPDALGLRPDQLHDGPGGITDLFGTVLGNKGYQAVHLGSDVTPGQHGPGKISATILVPAGTKAAFPGQSAQDRGFFLDKEQPLLITRVDPDGMGGWRLAAVAEPHPGTGSSQVSQDLNPGRKGVGLTPEERAARLVQPSTMPEPATPPSAPATEATIAPTSIQAPAVGRTADQEAARVGRAAAGRQANVNEGNPPVQAPLPTPAPRPAPAPAAAPAAPATGGVPARTEPIHSPSIGATGTEGKSASEIANTPAPPETPPPPTLSPAEQGKPLKDAYMESGIESPTDPGRRGQFNRAYLNAKRTGGHPEQAVRDLETDIKRAQEGLDSGQDTTPHLADDIKSMNGLADLISTHFGVPRAKKEEPAPTSPVKRTGAPDEFLGEKKPGAREAAGVSGQASKTTTGLTSHEQAGSGPGTANIGGGQRGPQGRKNDAAKAAREAVGEQKPTVSAARVQAGDVVLARKNENGEWVHTATKTGATPITVTGKRSGDGAHVIEGTDPDGNKVTLNPIRGQNVLHRHKEKAPKAPSEVGRAKVLAQEKTDAAEVKAEKARATSAASAAEKPTKATKAAAPKLDQSPEAVAGRRKIREAEAAHQGDLSGETKAAERRGKTRTSDIKSGDRIMVAKDSEGQVVPEFVRGDKETFPATVVGHNDDGSLKLRDDSGQEMNTVPDAPHGTFYRKETPTEARRVAKAAPTKAAAIPEIPVAEKGTGRHIGTPTEARAAAKSMESQARKASEDATGVRKMAKDSGIPNDGGGLVTEAEQRLHEGQSPDEVGKWLDQQATKLSDDAAKAHVIKESDDLHTASGKRQMVREANDNADKLRELADRVRGKGPEGPATSPSLEERQGADSAGVDRVLKAYNDILAKRGDQHDRRVSIADIRAEVGGDLNRAELTRALREVGRGGSGHGGLLSRGVKPDARTEANGMDMGGEKVHFLQLPRPGEEKRGGETVPHPKGETPAPEVVKEAKKVAKKAAPKAVAKPAPTADQAEISKVASAFHADWQKTQAQEGNGRKPKFKTTKDEAWIKAHGTDQVDIANTDYAGLPDDWQKENRDAAQVAQGILKKHGGTVDLSDEKMRLEVGDEIHKAWLARENNSYAKGGELDKPFAELPRSEQDKDTDQLKVAMAALGSAKKAAPAKDAVAATKKAYEDIVGRRGPEADRKVSLQDIRQELQLNHNFSKPEVDKALRELSRGGSEHGGLISPATGKPSAREAAGAMKMGGEDVHFLQLPRPGEAGRGGETTPNAPEVSAPEAPTERDAVRNLAPADQSIYHRARESGQTHEQAMATVAAPAPAEEAKSLDKMTKDELLKHPDAEGARKSWTKARIKQHIEDRQGIKSAVAERPATAATEKPSTEDRIASKLLERMKPEMRDRILADMTPEERKAVEEAQRKVAGLPPTASTDLHPPTPTHEAARVLGRKAPRPTTPIDNEPRANEFTKAWDAAGIPEAPGSAGRSMKEIRKDLAEGKIDPAEGVRRMESEVSFNKDELSQVEADLRAPDLTDKQRAELQDEHAKLSEGIKAQEKASEFLRGHFGGPGDKPTVEEVKVHLPATFGDTLKAAKPEEMDEVARIQGLNPPKGDTAEEKFNDLMRQTIEKGLSEREAAKTEKAAKAEAARVKKEAREAGKAEFRPGGEKHLDAAKIAEGIDAGDIQQYVDDAQVELNDGKSPKQVADRVRFMARGLADTNAIIHGSRDRGVGAFNPESPEDKLARETELAKGRDKVKRLTELADRIEGSKRPRKPRAPSTKLTPSDHAAAKEAAKATGTPVAEVRTAIEDSKKADAKLQELGIPSTADELHARVVARAAGPFNDAKTAQEAHKAATSMHGNLTLAEIRKMGAEHGIKGRSKKDITDQIIARRFPEPSADEPVVVRKAGEPTGFAIPPRPTRERLSGAQFKDRLKPGDQIDVHLGGGKTRRDAVDSISPQGTMTTKGGYKYTTHSDVEVSKVEAGAGPAARATKAASPQPQATPKETLAALQNFENPPSREEAHGMIAELTRPELQSMAKELSIPGATGKNKEQLRSEIVEATAGRRLDSIAVRGFTGRSPLSDTSTGTTEARRHQETTTRLAAAKAAKKAGPAAEPMLSPEAEKERRTKEVADNMARLNAAKAVKKAAPTKAAPVKKAAKATLSGEARIEVGKFSDKPFREQTWGGASKPGDVRYHESGVIGAALDMMGSDQRLDVGGEPLRNVLGQIATDVNRQSITPSQGLERYKALAARLPRDTKARQELERAIQQIDSPPRKPDLPEGTPAFLRKLADQLAEIPIARQAKVGRSDRKGELDQVEELARELTDGKPKSIFTAHGALEKLLSNRHESASDAGHSQILAAIREAIKGDEAARQAERKARAKAAEAGPKAEGGPAAIRVPTSHTPSESLARRAVRTLLSSTKHGREVLDRVEGGHQHREAALRLVRQTPVRPSLSMARSSREVGDVLSREAEHITGHPVKVDIDGVHEDVARGFAEGVLQALEAHPGADLKSVLWGTNATLPDSPTGQWTAYADPDTQGIVIRGTDTWHQILHHFRQDSGHGIRSAVARTPQAIGLHEFAHILTFGPHHQQLLRDASDLMLAHYKSYGLRSTPTLQEFVSRQISSYAWTNNTEMLAEAFADVKVNGHRASPLSQDLYRLLLAHNPGR